jgi:hypothetical protein
MKQRLLPDAAVKCACITYICAMAGNFALQLEQQHCKSLDVHLHTGSLHIPHATRFKTMALSAT